MIQGLWSSDVDKEEVESISVSRGGSRTEFVYSFSEAAGSCIKFLNWILKHKLVFELFRPGQILPYRYYLSRYIPPLMCELMVMSSFASGEVTSQVSARPQNSDMSITIALSVA